MRKLLIATAAVFTMAACDRLDETDAERLALACKRVQQADAKLPSDASRRAMRQEMGSEANRDAVEAAEAHARVWHEIEQKRGKFLPSGWKCGSYNVDRYIR